MANCEYCHAIGACPKCWGRAGYDRLTREKTALLEALERIVSGDRRLTVANVETATAALRAAKGDR